MNNCWCCYLYCWRHWIAPQCTQGCSPMELSLRAENAPSKAELNGGSIRTVEAIIGKCNLRTIYKVFSVVTAILYNWHLCCYKCVKKMTTISYHKLDNTKLYQLQSHTLLEVCLCIPCGTRYCIGHKPPNPNLCWYHSLGRLCH